MAGPGGPKLPAPEPKLRLDKWLWQARFFKTRALAAEVVEAGHLRLNGQRCSKPGHAVAHGDTLTFPQGPRIRLIRVLEPGARRGPATEARRLYLDLDASAAPDELPGHGDTSPA